MSRMPLIETVLLAALIVGACAGLLKIGGESKGCLIKGCLNSTKIPKVGIPKAGIPKVGIPKTGIPKAGVPKSGIPKTGIRKAGIPKLGVPKTGRFTARLLQTPFTLPLTQVAEIQASNSRNVYECFK